MGQLFFFHEYGRRVGMVRRSSLKGGKNSLMVRKEQGHPTQPNQTTQSPQAESSIVFPLYWVKRKRKRVTRNGPDFTNEKHIGAGLYSSKVTKKGFKGTLLHACSDQRPHCSAAKSWSRCRSGASQCSNVGCIHVKWSSVSMQHWKRPFLWHNPCNWLHLQVHVTKR